MLTFTEAQVREALPMNAAIGLMEGVFGRLASGEAINQPRRRLALPTGAALHYMAGADGNYFGTKIYSTHPGGGMHFVFLLYRAEDAQLLALFEANHLGQIRTGAASGYATRLLARPDAATVGLIGSGFQARTQLEAMRAVRPIREVRVWSRSAQKREAFARECGAIAVDTAEQAVRGAAIVITATSSRDPVLDASWVAPGAHVNAMGSNQAARRELPAALVHSASLVAVDSLEQARIESGDLLLALPPERWTEHNIVELKDVRERPAGDAVTIFKSNGIAVEDVAAAAYVYEKALYS